jgi:hypothetical protein
MALASMVALATGGGAVEGSFGGVVPSAPVALAPRTATSLFSAGLPERAVVAAIRAEAVSPPPRVHAVIGWLHTDGTSILDRNGHRVRFAGVDVSGMGHGWGSTTPDAGHDGCASWRPPPSSEYRNIKAWGFNAVRVSLSWANLEPSAPPGGLASNRHRYNLAYVRALDRVVHGFTRRGLAVILQMAQSHWSPAIRVQGPHHLKCGVGMPGWLHPGGSPGNDPMDSAKRAFFSNRGGVQRAYAAAWRFMARRYSRNRLVVGADMMNEPFALGALRVSRLHLRALYERVGAAILRANPHLLLIFQDSQYLGPGTLALHAPPSLPNVVYSFHLYRSNWNPDGRNLTSVFLDRARSWGVPLWISEFDAFGHASPQGGPADWAAQLRRMMAFCRRNDVGWSEFAYARRWMFLPGTVRPKPGLISILRSGR